MRWRERRGERGGGGGCILWIQNEKEQKKNTTWYKSAECRFYSISPITIKLSTRTNVYTNWIYKEYVLVCVCVCVSCTCVRHSARGLLPSPACCGPGSVCLTPRTWPPPYPGNHMTEANVLSASLSGADERPAGDWSPARSSASALLARRHRASVIKPMSSGSSWSSRARDKAGETCQWLFVPN